MAQKYSLKNPTRATQNRIPKNTPTEVERERELRRSCLRIIIGIKDHKVLYIFPCKWLDLVALHLR